VSPVISGEHFSDRWCANRKANSTVPSLVIVANRLPVQAPARGRGPWTRAPGGLAEAIHRTLAARGGTWIGWPGGRSFTAPPDDLGYDLLPVGLDAADLRGYYDGFANATLWPLYHDLIRQPSTTANGGATTYG
jgi:trehalose 6-phosphate synthase